MNFYPDSTIPWIKFASVMGNFWSQWVFKAEMDLQRARVDKNLVDFLDLRSSFSSAGHETNAALPKWRKVKGRENKNKSDSSLEQD